MLTPICFEVLLVVPLFCSVYRPAHTLHVDAHALEMFAYYIEFATTTFNLGLLPTPPEEN